MFMNKKIKIILFIVIGIVILAAIVLGVIFTVKLWGNKCEPLTPLALEKFAIVGGERPISGDKCDISSKSYLLRLVYDKSSQAERAKTGLQLATPGDIDDIGGLEWITEDGDSSVFWTNDEKLGILVIPGEDSEKIVDKQIKKAFKKLE